MVSLDIYLNETTRHADLILPSTVQLEHENYDFLFETTSVHNFSRWSPTLFEPSEDQRDQWRIYCELGARLGREGRREATLRRGEALHRHEYGHVHDRAG